MGYRVDYQPIKKVRGAEKRKSGIPALTALCLLVFLLLVNSCWPRGARVLRSLLLPGDAAVTVAALEDFAVELGAGDSFPGAFENFCRRVIQGAEIDPD